MRTWVFIFVVLAVASVSLAQTGGSYTPPVELQPTAIINSTVNGLKGYLPAGIAAVAVFVVIAALVRGLMRKGARAVDDGGDWDDWERDNERYQRDWVD